jgi:thiamine-phosphate pyrophosphorylase
VKLIVISPEAEDAREHAVLASLFAAGLTSYHLRKPTWTRDQLAAWLGALPAEFHPRIVLHSHHDLANEFAVGGVHEREAGRAGPLGPPSGLVTNERPTGAPSGRALPRSRAVHDVAALRESLAGYDRLLVSPIFPSFSKPGYGPSKKLPEGDLRAVLALPRRAEVIALGGIEVSRIAACRELGFDGVAVLGAIWQAADPLCAFHELSRAVAEALALH